MPDATPHLGLPYIAAAQAQKYVTHNEALHVLDCVVQLAALDQNLTSPPGSPTEGDRYIVGPSATGAWAGHDGEIAAYVDAAWSFYSPGAGWIAFVVDEATLYYWTGSAWASMQGVITALQNLALLGIGTTADATNPFSAKLNKALWTAKTAAEGGDGDLRYTMNKETAADTVSLLMQDGYSGRAEVGLIGDDNLTLKVSADGSSYTIALTIDKATGKVSLAEHSKFSAYVNYDKYIGAGAWTSMGMNNARHNDQGDFDAGAGVFTAPHAGYFLFGAGYQFKANSTVPTAIRVGLSVNGAAPASDAYIAQGDATIVTLESGVQITAMLKLSAGDTVDVQAYMATNDGYVLANANHFWGCQIA